MAAITPPTAQIAAHIKSVRLVPASWAIGLTRQTPGITPPTTGQLFPFLYLFILMLFFEKFGT